MNKAFKSPYIHPSSNLSKHPPAFKNEKSVKIPLDLLTQTIYLLEHLNLSGYDMTIQHVYNDVYGSFLQKQHDLDLRAAYSAIIHAASEDARFKARMRYLQLKHEGVCFRGWF